MQFSLEQIKKVALLARLAITLEEEERYAGQLSVILDHVEELKSASLADEQLIPMVSHSEDELRADTTDGGRHQREILAGAPQRQDNFFVVPAVFGGE